MSSLFHQTTVHLNGRERTIAARLHAVRQLVAQRGSLSGFAAGLVMLLAPMLGAGTAQADVSNIMLLSSNRISGSSSSVSGNLLGAQPGDVVIAVEGSSANKPVATPTGTLGAQFTQVVSAQTTDKSKPFISTATYMAVVTGTGNPVVTSKQSDNLELWLFRPAAGLTLALDKGTAATVSSGNAPSITSSAPYVAAGDLVVATAYIPSFGPNMIYAGASRLNCNLPSGQAGTGTLDSCVNTPNGQGWYTGTVGDQPVFLWSDTNADGTVYTSKWATTVIALTAR